MLPRKKCPQCSKSFVPSSPHHLFCCKTCCDGYSKQRTWRTYFRAILNVKKKNRANLSPDFLANLYHKQEGLCALSGVPLTKVTGRGTVPTNASIDRISPGGPYSEDNVRLVCRFVNGFRSNLTDQEFIWWAKRIAKHNG
jgi:hypothetical protein